MVFIVTVRGAAIAIIGGGYIPPLSLARNAHEPARMKMQRDLVSVADVLYYVHVTCLVKPLAYIQQMTGFQTPATA